MQTLNDLRDEFEFLDGFDRIELLINLGRSLEVMPAALKTDQTLIRGCQSPVWAYPTQNDDGTLHFLADSLSLTVKGIIALVLMTVQDRKPDEILKIDIEGLLKPFSVEKHITSKRTSGIPNMIAKIRETAARYA